MNESLKKLLILQERDRKILKLTRESKDLPARIADIKEQLRDAQEALEEARDDQMRKTSSVKQIELDVESRNEHIRKLRTQQYEIKTNEGYRAIDHEIVTLRKLIRGLEDQELTLLEDIEKLNAIVELREAKLAEREAHVKDDLDMLDERMSKIGGKIDKLKVDRDELMNGIEKSWLSRYTRIIQNRKDFALVPVEDATNCGGCHMQIPPQLVHDARKGNSMVPCSYCGRLLYWNG